MLPMFHARQDLAFRCSIPGQFVGDDHARNIFQSFEELAKEFLCGLFVAAALHQDVQHVAILVDRSPKGMLLATDREDDLVQMPFVPALGTPTAQFVGRGLPEF
ncbi:MAG: hypothetical protein PVSMB2_22630 [Ktedonobacteraceae bacterium]